MGGLKLGKEAQAKFDEAKGQPDKAGYLEKKGAKRKNWNQRWFVLKDNYLFYCKSEKTLPQGIINLHGCTVSKLEGPNTRQFSFSLLAPKSVSVDAKWTNRTYLMSAKNADEYAGWMQTLESAGRRSVERAQAAKAAASGSSANLGTANVEPKPATPASQPAAKAEEESDSESSSEEPPAKKIEGPLPIKREESGRQMQARRKEESSEDDGPDSDDDSDDRAAKPAPAREGSIRKEESSSRPKEESSDEEPEKLPSTPKAEKHRKKEKKHKREKKEKKSKKEVKAESGSDD